MNELVSLGHLQLLHLEVSPSPKIYFAASHIHATQTFCLEPGNLVAE
jgi:hypothetical protein